LRILAAQCSSQICDHGSPVWWAGEVDPVKVAYGNGKGIGGV
jgi:hypothetical protein